MTGVTPQMDDVEPIALDVHVHLAPLVPERIDGLAGVDIRDGALVIDGNPVSVAPLYQPDRLLSWMDDNRIARALVSAPPPLYRAQLDAGAAADWLAYVNEGLQEICARRSDRLMHLPHLPVDHPELALKIARRWRETGVPGFCISAGGARGAVLSDEAYTPLWSHLDRQRCVLFIHPGACCDDRLKAFYLDNLLGNPHESAVAVAHLVFSAVPVRYPGIRFCVAHGGGTTAMAAGRWQRGFETARPGVDTTLPEPRSVLGKIYTDCIVHDASALELSRSVFGADRIVFGSDWPFPMGLPEPHRQLNSVAEEFRRRILRENAAGLLTASKD